MRNITTLFVSVFILLTTGETLAYRDFNPDSISRSVYRQGVIESIPRLLSFELCYVEAMELSSDLYYLIKAGEVSLSIETLMKINAALEHYKQNSWKLRHG